MVTWNRREYFEKTIKNLLDDPSDFSLYFWDNGSADGVRDIISDLRDDRIVSRHYNKENVGQFDAWQWFMNVCRGDIAGKLDDDILAEHGWMLRLAKMLVEHPELGLIGGWPMMPSDWNESLAQHKIVQLGQQRIFRNGWVAGGIFLGRIKVLKQYTSNDPKARGVPLKQLQMTKDGFINGFPIPILFAEHLDDPRSPHCRMNRPGGWDQFAAYTARMRNLSGPEEFGRWLAADARKILETSVQDQVRMAFPTRVDKLEASMIRILAKLRKPFRRMS
jgi:glycosyltransferase involved in cell wall biosynthesis